jgi:hypothetical protein
MTVSAVGRMAWLVRGQDWPRRARGQGAERGRAGGFQKVPAVPIAFHHIHILTQ